MARKNLPFSLILRRNNGKSSTNGKYYASRFLPQTLNTRGLAQHLIDHGLIAQRNEVEEGLFALAECIPELCVQGKSVKLDGIGTFRTTLTGKGSETSEYNAQLIKGVHIRLIPDTTSDDNLSSRQFKNRCSFEIIGYQDTAGGPIKSLNYQQNNP